MTHIMAPDVATQAQSALASSPIQALRELCVLCDGDRLLITGRVDSFYHKQLAQEMVRLIAKGLQVVNTVEVAYGDQPDPWKVLGS